MKKQIKLYNIILPIWLLFLFPQVWLVVIPGNLLIDCVVLLAALTVLKHRDKRGVLKDLWWKFWLFGFLADFVGVAVLLPAAFLPEWLSGSVAEWWSDNLTPILYNAFKTPAAFLWTLAGVAVAGLCIYLFDKRAMRSCGLLTEREKRIVALTMAVITAPWTFFIPMY